VGTFAPRAVKLGALVLQPPLELGAVHGLRVHINVYHVKHLRGLAVQAGGLRLGERTGTVSYTSPKKREKSSARLAFRENFIYSDRDAEAW
jgi:hypothetical protein